MFEKVLSEMGPIPLSEAELDEVVSKDTEGKNATVADMISDINPSMLKLFNRSAGRKKHVKPVRTLNEEEIRDVVEAHLDAIPKDEVFCIVGRGSFTPEQLRKEVVQRTEVGQRFVESVLQNNAFLEEAIKMKKIEPRKSDVIEIPGFDF